MQHHPVLRLLVIVKGFFPGSFRSGESSDSEVNPRNLQKTGGIAAYLVFSLIPARPCAFVPLLIAPHVFNSFLACSPKFDQEQTSWHNAFQNCDLEKMLKIKIVLYYNVGTD
jgi:hypothetical protein